MLLRLNQPILMVLALQHSRTSAIDRIVFSKNDPTSLPTAKEFPRDLSSRLRQPNLTSQFDRSGCLIPQGVSILNPL